MTFPAGNQTFQKKNFNGYKESGPRRIADSTFDARVSTTDNFRSPWNTDESLYGPHFAVLDGIGMAGSGKKLSTKGNRPSGSQSVSFSEWSLDVGNGHAIQGGRGAYLRCPVTLSKGHGVRFVWRFGSTLLSPDKGRDYVGFALARFIDGNYNPVTGANGWSYDVLCTTRDLPGYANYPTHGLLQTDGWNAHNLIYSGNGTLNGYAEWIVSSGHYYQVDTTAPNQDKADAYPCCLAIDHIVLI